MTKEIFGIELEVPLKVGVTVSQFTRQLAASIGDDKVYQTSVRVGYHSTEYNNAVDLWRVASDGSLGAWGSRGIEVVSRRRTSLEEVAIAMAGTEHLVDKALLARSTCGGHHVHIGLLHFSAIKRSYNPETTNGIRKLVRTKRVKKIEIKIHEVYAYFQPVINALVSQSRRTGGRAYNRGVSPSYLEAKDRPNSSYGTSKNEYLNDKDRAAPWHGNRGVVNFGRLGSYGTVEYRQHQGTYSVATVTNWVKLMHRITSRCWVQETKNIDPADYPITVDGFADFLGLGANRVRAWMRRRANHFGYPAIARENGVNPSVGVRVRSSEPLQAPNPRRDHHRRDELYQAIVLACGNHEPTYNALRALYRAQAPHVGDAWEADNIKDICGVNIPNELLPSGYNPSDGLWDSLNWQSIRNELTEAIHGD